MSTAPTLTHWGPHLIEADGQRITAVHGHPSDPDPSPIGQGLRAVNECRVARPSVRRSWLEHGPGAAPELRGKEPFVEISWDEAFALVGAELARVRDNHGAESIYAGSYGWGSAGSFHHPSTQARRFFRLFGPVTTSALNYSSAAAMTIVPYIFGTPWYPTCQQAHSWSVIADHCEFFVSFGSLRLNNSQVHFGGQGAHHTRGWIEKAAVNGTQFLNIGPVRDDQASEANGRWQPIRPGTDVALMAGLIHCLIESGTADEDFCTRYCEGWSEFRAYITGETDQTPKTAEWAADISGIDAAAIRSLAAEMATKRTLINLSFSVQRTDHGEQPYWMATALAAALGQIGLPGGGISFSYGSHGRSGSGEPYKRLPRLPMAKSPGGTVISVARVVEMLESPGEPFDFDGSRGVFPDVRVVYWAGGNVFHHHQDLNRLCRAWQRPDTIIVNEPFWSPMAKWADIVLPATTSMERTDLGDSDRQLVPMHRVVEPHAEAMSDHEIFAGIAEQLGLGDEFTEGRTADEWVEHLYEMYVEQNPGAPTYDDFIASDGFDHPDMVPFGTATQVFLGDFRSDPEANALRTPSGRIEIHSSTIEAYGYDDCPPHPTWMEPYERLGAGENQEGALHLVSNQPTTRLHSQYDHSEISLATKVAGREPARLHPDEAASRSLGDGDVIRVFNDRGSCLAGVLVSDDVAPGVVQLATGAWFDPDGSGMCKHGNPNVLTRDKGTSKLAQGTSAHTCIVEVEKFVGTPPPVTAFDPPELISRT